MSDSIELTAKARDLCRLLEPAARIAGRKATIEALRYAHCEASTDGLTVSATDFDLRIIASCPAEVKRRGAFLVPCVRLRDLVGMVGEESDVRIVATEGSKPSVTITTGSHGACWTGPPVSAYPVAWERPVGEPVTVEAAVLAGLIAHVLPSVPAEGFMHIPAAAEIKAGADQLQLSSTDGYRMSVASQAAKGIACGNIVLGKLALRELGAFLSGADTATLTADSNRLLVEAPGRSLVANLPAGRVPNVDRVVPKDVTSTCTFGRDQLLAAIRRVALVQDRDFGKFEMRAIAFRLEPTRVRLSAVGAGIGQAEEYVPADLVGRPVELKFNAAYLVDFLSLAQDGRVQLEIADADRPTLWSECGSSAMSYRYVLVPMRL